MPRNRLLKIGLIGAAVTAVCCFTPILVIPLSIIGFTFVIGWLDIILFPLLAIFIILVVIGLWKTASN